MDTNKNSEISYCYEAYVIYKPKFKICLEGRLGGAFR